MEKTRLTFNSMNLSNLSQSMRTRKSMLKSSQNSNIIKHYKLIKKLKKGGENKNKQKVTSYSLYINNSQLKKKFKLLFYFPVRRINSTRINHEKLYKIFSFFET